MKTVILAALSILVKEQAAFLLPTLSESLK